MTTEEAIRILGPKTTADALTDIEYYGGFGGQRAAVKAVEDACLVAIAALERSRWIPADEQLPPNGEDVLCWYEYFRFGEYNRMFQTFGIGYQYNGNWGGEVANGQKARVLSWMPLPEPPKEALKDG